MRRYTNGMAFIRPLLIATAAVIGLALVSCGGGGGDGGDGGTPASTVLPVVCPGSGTTDVSIVDFQFILADIQVPVNTVVKWTNIGPSVHTVTSTVVPANGTFGSGNLSAGAAVCFQFTEAGTYNYNCSIHPLQMTGTVTVQ